MKLELTEAVLAGRARHADAAGARPVFGPERTAT